MPDHPNASPCTCDTGEPWIGDLGTTDPDCRWHGSNYRDQRPDAPPAAAADLIESEQSDE